MTSRFFRKAGNGQSSIQTGMSFRERLRAYSTSRFTHSEPLEVAVMTTTSVSAAAMPCSISGQNSAPGGMERTSLNTSSKPAARRKDSISAT